MKKIITKVLIADNNEETRTILRNTLENDPDIEILESRTGKETIEKGFNENPDVVILETQLPDKHGFDILETLKASQSTHDIPVILVSSNSVSAEEIVDGLEIGAVDFISRPIHPAEFTARIKVAIRNYKIQKLLKEKAATDTLTGLYNRSVLEYRLQTELKRAQRHGIPISAVMLDIDNFKMINDTYGHLFGDQVLKALGEILLKRARTEDIIVRYGGEEFLLLLFGADVQGSFAFAERVRLDFQSKIFHVNGQSVHFTLSAGLGQYKANDSQNAFLDKADKALYVAKKSGKNKVCIYESDNPNPTGN